jgi:hypothetical protein
MPEPQDRGPAAEGPTAESSVREAAPGAATGISLVELQAACDGKEATLRMQYPPDGRLPAHDEASLARHAHSTIRGALLRYALLTHLFLSRDRAAHAATASSGEQAERAMHDLLRRKPVRVYVGRHAVDVTSRSYAALAEIAGHSMRLRTLRADADRLEELLEEALSAHPSRAERGRHRRRLRRLEALHRRLVLEAQLHRRAIYAHLATPDGRPARSLADAPAWADTVDPAADTALMTALFEAGAGRYQRLGAEPSRGGDAGTTRVLEDFGWHSHFAMIERNRRAPEASLYDRDLYQLLGWLRAGATESGIEDLDDADLP